MNKVIAERTLLSFVVAVISYAIPLGSRISRIAYGTKFVNIREIAKAGLLISIIGIFLLAVIRLLW